MVRMSARKIWRPACRFRVDPRRRGEAQIDGRWVMMVEMGQRKNPGKQRKIAVSRGKRAEREGFEPSVALLPHRFSRPARSTTPASLRGQIILFPKGRPIKRPPR